MSERETIKLGMGCIMGRCVGKNGYANVAAGIWSRQLFYDFLFEYEDIQYKNWVIEVESSEDSGDDDQWADGDGKDCVTDDNSPLPGTSPAPRSVRSLTNTLLKPCKPGGGASQVAIRDTANGKP